MIFSHRSNLQDFRANCVFRYRPYISERIYFACGARPQSISISKSFNNFYYYIYCLHLLSSFTTLYIHLFVHLLHDGCMCTCVHNAIVCTHMCMPGHMHVHTHASMCLCVHMCDVCFLHCMLLINYYYAYISVHMWYICGTCIY